MMKSLTSSIGVLLLTAVASTWRIRLPKPLPGPNGVVAFWHGTMLPVWWVFRNSRPGALVSMSRDGQLLTSLLERWGYTVVRGSSSKGGNEALDAMVRLASESLVLVTPDGPRGPRCTAKAGAAIAAQRSGTPLFPVRTLVGWKWTFKRSWDRFVLPLPFAVVTVEVGDPIEIPADANHASINMIIQHLSQELGTC